MLMAVVEDGKAVELVMDYLPSVCVRVGGKPSRRLGIEITTQNDVGYGGDVLKLWCVVMWY